MFILICLQKISETVTDTTISLYNEECQSHESPVYCPNQWKYLDAKDEWKIDEILQIKCGKMITYTIIFV